MQPPTDGPSKEVSQVPAEGTADVLPAEATEAALAQPEAGAAPSEQPAELAPPASSEEPAPTGAHLYILSIRFLFYSSHIDYLAKLNILHNHTA